MAFNNITAEETKTLLDGGEGYIYLDVRSEMEFERGHASGAYNIPLKNVNPAIQMMEDNPDFVEVVEKTFPKDAKLLIGCASGTRSYFSCQILQQRGYQHLANIDGGFSGKRDMFGNIIQKGWMDLGFPVESGDGGEKGYAALRDKK